jgi:molecular chaperone GrpE
MKRAHTASVPEQSEEARVAREQPVTSQSQSEKLSAAGRATTSSDLETVTAERDALRDRIARMQAEFENARKHLLREQQEFRDSALTETLTALLPVLDSFDRALNAPADNLEGFRCGVDLIRKQLHDALKKAGLEPMQEKGKRFDPRIHEARDSVETSAVEEDHVAEELQRGYKLADRLLRPALVIVSRSPKT